MNRERRSVSGGLTDGAGSANRDMLTGHRARAGALWLAGAGDGPVPDGKDIFTAQEQGVEAAAEART